MALIPCIDICPCRLKVGLAWDSHAHIEADQVLLADTHKYRHCCQPFHLGSNSPETAEQLMRSRYSAYVLKLHEYLITTHHPKTSKNVNKSALEQTFGHTQWLGLSVISQQAGSPSDNVGKVEFIAHFRNIDHHKSNDIEQLRECSRFRRFQHQWHYVDGVFT